jgi:hypothetical protein
VDYAGIAATIASAIFWSRASALEGVPAWRWILPSIGISVVILFAFRGSWVAVLAGQAAMFAGITAYRAAFDKDPPP